MKDSIVRAKRFEKLLERKRKKVDKAQQKIEEADQSSQTLYTNPDGSIDWNRLAKHVSEATRGR